MNESSKMRAGVAPWTVGDLIRALQQLPEEAIPLVEGYEEGFDEILELVTIEQAEFRPNALEWNGSYGNALDPDDYQDNREGSRPAGQAVVIRGKRR